MIKDEDMFQAYRLCLRHKKKSLGAIEFRFNYEQELIALVDEVNNRTYHPSTSTVFMVTRPKYREVFAAAFRDRIIHHYIAMRIEPLYEEIFGDRTFNCRKGKGTLYGINTLKNDIRECSENYTKDCYIAKFDLHGFFMSINKIFLCEIVHNFINEHYFGEDKEDVLWLMDIVILHCPEKDCVFHSPLSMWDRLPKEKSLFTNGDNFGVPIGNLQSQLNTNFLLHIFDMYVIHVLGIKYYGRYVDDFYIINKSEKKILNSVPKMRNYLKVVLGLELHKDKFYIQHYSKGVTFTGTIVKFDRTYPAVITTKGLIAAIGRINNYKYADESIFSSVIASANSYLGLMSHQNSYYIRKNILSRINKCLFEKIYINGHYETINEWDNDQKGREKGWGEIRRSVMLHPRYRAQWNACV